MVLDFLRKTPVAVPERKASASARVAFWGMGGRVAWSPRDAVSLTRAGFLGNPVGFRSVRMIAEAAAALPVVCQDARCRYDSHPVLALMTRPNPAQGRADLLEAVITQLMLSGNAYLEAVQGCGRGAGGIACAALGPDASCAGGRWLAGGL
jgi:phage portal protein BeeE